MISENKAVNEIIAKEQGYMADLARVTTISEVMTLYDIQYHSSVVYAIDSGHITAVQSGSVWLISMNSVIAYYGKPPLDNIEKS